MFNSLAKKEISFKELEQKVYKYVCELGCEITKMILETYDNESTKVLFQIVASLRQQSLETSCKTLSNDKEYLCHIPYHNDLLILLTASL